MVPIAGDGNGGMDGIMKPCRGDGTASGQDMRRGNEMGAGVGYRDGLGRERLVLAALVALAEGGFSMASSVP